MSDQSNNVPDTFGGGSHKRKPPFTLPAAVQPVPTFSDGYGDPGAITDSDRVVEQLRHTLARDVGSINKPGETRQQVTPSSPLKEIAQRIKKLVHDDGEQMGDELKAKITDGVSVAKALQVWADDTLREKPVEKILGVSA